MFLGSNKRKWTWMNHGAKTRPWIIMWLLGVSHARMKQLYWVPPGSLSEGLSRKGCHHAVPSGQQGHGWSCRCCRGDTAQWDISKSGSGKLLEDVMQNIHCIWFLIWHLRRIPESSNCLNPIPQLLAAATRPMNIAEILDITTQFWQEMPRMMDCFVWQFAWFRQ